MSRSLGGSVVDAPLADADLAAADLLEPGDHAQQRRLAAARRADQHGERAVGDVDVDAVQDRDLAEVLLDRLDRDAGHAFRAVETRGAERPTPREPDAARVSALQPRCAIGQTGRSARAAGICMMTRSPCRFAPAPPGRGGAAAAWSPSGCPTGSRRGWATQIEAGALRPGDRLPTEQQLAHRARRLAHRGARGRAPAQVARPACARARARACSSPPRRRNQPLAFDPSVLDSIDAVVQVREVRRALEGETAALAAERATRAQIAGAAARAAGDRRSRGRRRRRRRGRPGLPPRARRSHRQPAVRPPARLPGAVPARGDARDARQRGAPADFMDAVRTEHRAIVDAIAARDAQRAAPRPAHCSAAPAARCAA